MVSIIVLYVYIPANLNDPAQANHASIHLLHTISSKANTIGNNTINQTQEINLLDNSNYLWESFIDAKVFQNDDEGLNIIVDTNKKDKTYNRAYLQTRLNSTTGIPLVLSLDYSFKPINANASLALEIRDNENNILSSHTLGMELTSSKFLLSKDITNKPIEFRFYIITEEPGLYLLAIREARLQTKI